MRHFAFVTVARSDYSFYLPILRCFREEAEARISVIAAAAHLVPALGSTVDLIEEEGFEIADRIEMTLASDDPRAIATATGVGLIGFAGAYDRLRPDAVVLLGDRYETMAAAAAALPFSTPLAHISGGDVTEGAMDDAIRHAVTKLSHLHFVSTDTYRRRVIQMGEDPARVFVTGSPSLDLVASLDRLPPPELAEHIGMPLDPPPLLVTFHPVTRETEDTERQIRELLAAVRDSGLPALFTAPNTDTRASVIFDEIRRLAERNGRYRLVASLGPEAYFSMLEHAAAMVGNSSSGIIEAASFRLPVVNVGTRQKGRIRARNVIDVPCDRSAILGGIRRATSPEFGQGLEDLENPYGDGRAAERIVDILMSADLDRELLRKPFFDLPVTVHA